MIPNIYFILGGPGSGKGTQCQLLAKAFNFIHLSAGQLLRNNSNNPEIEEYLNKGLIVPSKITIDLLQKEIKKHEKQNTTILIDGFPRNQENLKGFLNTKIPFKKCLCIQLPEEIMLQRILSRKEGRTDDTQLVFLNRIQVFTQETKPVLNWFKQKNFLVEIDGIGTPQQVQDRIIQLIFKN